ncbi:pyridine nucleotide-disulfide oxidoreductase family protein [Apiospora kogelbergensis]|uniref:pyridine nucleotide-disulfide oxidoreductase family protein n=1 Tax=Apiospora kogelbergensis TaxID=1337665 RepID=UPI00312D4942
MRVTVAQSSAAVLALAASGVAAANACNADNCLRAMRASQVPGRLEDSRAFCSSFTAASASASAAAMPTFVAEGCQPNQLCLCLRHSVGHSFRLPTAACAAVSAAWASQVAATPSATPTVAAKVAYACLNSVPVAKEAALKFIDELAPYLEWQSDTDWKKDPPATYFYPGYDMWAELASVRAGVVADKYKSEYAWQADMYLRVFGPAHDGHLYLYSDVLTNGLEWARPFALVSVSEDGMATPEVKVYEDVMSSPETASTLTKINGKDAVAYLEDAIFAVSGNQDKDSAYNSLFYEKAFAASKGTGYFKQGGRTRFVYPGETTTFGFANGTERELANSALVKGNWTGVVDGASFFKKFAPNADPAVAAPTPAAPSTPAPGAATPTGVPGYPKPVIVSSDAVVSGYFLDQPGFEDVAVLSMLSFSPASPVEFQTVVQEFFDKAVAAGKKKLVVDVQVNGGGYIFQGYDTFRQIFPDIEQEGTGHWRYSPGFEAVSKVFSKNCEGYDPYTAPDELIQQCEGVYNWGYDYNRDNKNFTSFKDKFPPAEFKNDKYTELIQWNFDNPLDTVNSTYGIGYDITGYGARKNFTRPFGGPENIVVLFDGYCASTCTLFSQFMKHDAGVQFIAMGGRPSVQGPIQGVGGVKGSQSYSFSNVYTYTQLAKKHTTDAALVKELDRFTTYPISRASNAGVNVKNEILRQNWDDGTPAQFVAEYADCRLFWKADMHKDITNLWTAAAAAAFKGGKCAFGAIDHSAKKAAARSESESERPAMFSKPRFTLPTHNKAPVPLRVPVAQSVVRRQAAEEKAPADKSWVFMANQHMVADN